MILASDNTMAAFFEDAHTTGQHVFLRLAGQRPSTQDMQPMLAGRVAAVHRDRRAVVLELTNDDGSVYDEPWVPFATIDTYELVADTPEPHRGDGYRERKRWYGREHHYHAYTEMPVDEGELTVTVTRTVIGWHFSRDIYGKLRWRREPLVYSEPMLERTDTPAPAGAAARLDDIAADAIDEVLHARTIRGRLQNLATRWSS